MYESPIILIIVIVLHLCSEMTIIIIWCMLNFDKCHGVSSWVWLQTIFLKLLVLALILCWFLLFWGFWVTAFATFRRRVKRTLYDLYLSIISQQEGEEALIQISMHEISAITEGGETTRKKNNFPSLPSSFKATLVPRKITPTYLPLMLLTLFECLPEKNESILQEDCNTRPRLRISCK